MENTNIKTNNSTSSVITPLPNTNFNAPINNPVATPPVIDASTIGTTPTTKVPTQTGTPAPMLEQNFAASQITEIPKTENQKFQERSVVDILGLTQDLSGKSAFQQQQEQQAGVFEKQKQFKEIADQITTRQAQLQQQKAQIGLTPMSFAAASGYENAIINAANSDILALNAQAQAVKGDYDLAIDTANRAVDAKYKPVQEKIDLIKSQLEAIQPLLTADEKKQSNEQLQRIKLEERAYNEKIAEEKEMKSLFITASQFQAPKSVLSQLQKLSNSDDPLAYFKSVAIAAPYLTDPIERSYKIAQTNKIINDAKEAQQGDPYELIAYAQQFASTGKIPTGMPKGSFGVVSQIAKELPKDKGTIVSKATGIAPDTLGAAGDAYGALYSAIELSKELRQLDNKRVGGLVSGTVGKVLGSKDQQQYVDLRDQIVDLLARARSGAAINDTELRQYQSMIPGRFSEPLGLGAQSGDKIDNFTRALTNDLQNKVNTKGWAVYGLSDVKVGNNSYKVGDIIDNGQGQQGRINADGTITIIQ